VFLLGLAAIGSWIYLYLQGGFLLSPFPNLDSVAPLSRLNTSPFIVYGFVPYWNLSKTVIQPELTHLAYFSFPITPEGELDGISNGKPTDTDASISSSRWRSAQLDDLVRQLKPNQAFTLTLTQFGKPEIETFLSSPSAQTQFQTSLQSFLTTTTRPVAGINIDIEYPGEATPALRQEYVEFVQRTRTTVDQVAQARRQPKYNLSISVYANAASRQLLWDIPSLISAVDHVVIMAYDFHRSSSPIAGPVAPMFGATQNWDNDLVLHLKEFLAQMPANKILLGVPFYGYEWETTTGDSRSLVFPGTGATASYGRVQRLLNSTNSAEIADGPITQGWDEDALSPYLIFTKDNRQHVIYYEDARSISYKVELVNELQLGGIAIWALGYEDGSRELWDAVQKHLEK